MSQNVSSEEGLNLLLQGVLVRLKEAENLIATPGIDPDKKAELEKSATELKVEAGGLETALVELSSLRAELKTSESKNAEVFALRKSEKDLLDACKRYQVACGVSILLILLLLFAYWQNNAGKNAEILQLTGENQKLEEDAGNLAKAKKDLAMAQGEVLGMKKILDSIPKTCPSVELKPVMDKVEAVCGPKPVIKPVKSTGFKLKKPKPTVIVAPEPKRSCKVINNINGETLADFLDASKNEFKKIATKGKECDDLRKMFTGKHPEYDVKKVE